MADEKRRRQKRLVWVLIGAVLLIGVWLYIFLSSDKEFESIEEFSVVWAQASDDDRPSLLQWLLNAKPERHTVYQVDQTRLAGLTQLEVEQFMPLGQSDQRYPNGGLVYRLGSIEPDPLGFIVAKQDWLVISFGPDGKVESIETIS